MCLLLLQDVIQLATRVRHSGVSFLVKPSHLQAIELADLVETRRCEARRVSGVAVTSGSRRDVVERGGNRKESKEWDACPPAVRCPASKDEPSFEPAGWPSGARAEGWERPGSGELGGREV